MARICVQGARRSLGMTRHRQRAVEPLFAGDSKPLPAPRRMYGSCDARNKDYGNYKPLSLWNARSRYVWAVTDNAHQREHFIA